MRASRLVTGPLLVLAVSALSACGVFKEQAPPPPCPEVAVLSDAATVTRFVEGTGRDLTDVLYEAQIVDAGGACQYDVDDDTGEGTLDVEMAVAMEVARGPANREGRAEIGYFVAITDADRAILNRQHFEGLVTFPGNTSRLEWRDEPVYLTISLKSGQTGADFRIYVGYVLSEEELQFNRSQAGTRRR